MPPCRGAATSALLLAGAHSQWAGRPVGADSAASDCGLGGAARDYRTAGQPLLALPEVDVHEYYAEHGRPFALELGVVEYAGPEATFNTRGYCGAIPGPTLIFGRGDREGQPPNRIDLVNNLESAQGEQYVLNAYSVPSTTNVHTHGLHLPHLRPGDDIKIKVEPQSSFSYEWPVVHEHAPGTHWYHPHVHGSTSLQVGGGALGMLVIEDEERDGVPQWLLQTKADELRLVITVLPQRMLEEIEAQSGAEHPLVTGTGPSILVLVNGQMLPEISMVKGRWYRWRMLFSSLHHRTQLVTTPGGCEFGVLAKDGVFLLDAPRALDYMSFASGNRVDVIIRCSADAELRTSTPHKWPPGPTGQPIYVPKNDSGVAGGEVAWLDPAGEQRAIATIRVTGSGGSNSTLADLGKVNAVVPDYLQDLRSHTVDGSHDLHIRTDHPGEPEGSRVNGKNGCSINYKVWRGDRRDNLFNVYAFTAEEYDVQADFHPLHVHVNPMQVQRDTLLDPWYQPGDWQDVVLSTGIYRQRFLHYEGVVMVHCHWLTHEDHGCISQFRIRTCPTDNIPAGVVGTCSKHEKEHPSDLWLSVPAVVGVCVLGAVAAIVVRRRRSRASRPKDPNETRPLTIAGSE